MFHEEYRSQSFVFPTDVGISGSFDKKVSINQDPTILRFNLDDDLLDQHQNAKIDNLMQSIRIGDTYLICWAKNEQLNLSTMHFQEGSWSFRLEDKSSLIQQIRGVHIFPQSSERLWVVVRTISACVVFEVNFNSLTQRFYLRRINDIATNSDVISVGLNTTQHENYNLEPQISILENNAIQLWKQGNLLTLDTPSQFVFCEYGAYPFTLLAATPTELYSLDFRQPSSAWKSILNIQAIHIHPVFSHVLCYNKWHSQCKGNQISNFSLSPSRLFEFALCTDHYIGVFDQRYCKLPLIAWNRHHTSTTYTPRSLLWSPLMSHSGCHTQFLLNYDNQANIICYLSTQSMNSPPNVVSSQTIGQTVLLDMGAQARSCPLGLDIIPREDNSSFDVFALEGTTLFIKNIQLFTEAEVLPIITQARGLLHVPVVQQPTMDDFLSRNSDIQRSPKVAQKKNLKANGKRKTTKKIGAEKTQHQKTLDLSYLVHEYSKLSLSNPETEIFSLADYREEIGQFLSYPRLLSEIWLFLKTTLGLPISQASVEHSMDNLSLPGVEKIVPHAGEIVFSMTTDTIFDPAQNNDQLVIGNEIIDIHSLISSWDSEDLKHEVSTETSDIQDEADEPELQTQTPRESHTTPLVQAKVTVTPTPKLQTSKKNKRLLGF